MADVQPEQPVFSDLRAATYIHPDISGASNISQFGFHHGPISPIMPNEPNTIATTGWERGECKISRVQAGICWIECGGGAMCGMCFTDKTSLYRHIRKQHFMPLKANPRGNITPAEMAAGSFSLKRYVVEQRWRRATFLLEPGRGPLGEMLNRFANECEDIARLDPAFAAHFGTRFHRDAVTPPTPVRGVRNRGPAPPENDLELPATPTPAQRARQVGMGIASAGRVRRVLQFRTENETDADNTEEENGEDGAEE